MSRPLTPELGESPRICVVRLSALGDVCLVVPLIRTLRRAFPRAQINWIIGRPAHELLAGLDGVEFIVVDKVRYPWDYLGWLRHLRAHTVDVLLAVQASFPANMLYPAIRAPLKIGFDRARAKDLQRWFVHRQVPAARQHLLDGFLSFASALGVSDHVIEWGLPISDSDHQFAAEKLPHTARWIAVNPAASKSHRTWIAERYAEVINGCIKLGDCRVVVTGGPAVEERRLGDAVLAHVSNRANALNLIGRTSPKQLAAVLARVEALVAPDTGPVHIATAVGTPVVGLYAVARPEQTGPYLSRHLVVNKYPQAVRQILGRDPDSVAWDTRVRSHRAMELITVDDVMGVLAPLLSQPTVRTS
jgi:heptosyltransferase I